MAAFLSTMTAPFLRVVGRLFDDRDDSIVLYDRNDHQDGPVVSIGGKTFPFDSWISPDIPPEGVYRAAAAPEIASVLRHGGNSVVVVFGESGTGRSAILEGQDGNGLLPLTLREIFKFVSANPNKAVVYQVLVSFLEVQGSNITDLLSTKGSPTLKEGKLIGLSNRKLESVGSLESVMSQSARARSEGSSKPTHRRVGSQTEGGLHTLITFTVVEFARRRRESVSSTDSDRPTTPSKRATVNNVRSIGFLCTARSGEACTPTGDFRPADMSPRDALRRFLRTCSGSVMPQILKPVLNGPCRVSVVATLGSDTNASLYSLNHVASLLPPPPPLSELRRRDSAPSQPIARQRPSPLRPPRPASAGSAEVSPNEFETLRNRLRQTERSASEDRRALESARKELINQQNERSHLEREIDALQSSSDKVTSLEHQVTVLQQRLTDEQERVRALESDRSQDQRQIDTLRSHAREHESVREGQASLEAKLHAVEDELFASRRQVRELSEEKDRLESTAGQLRDDMSRSFNASDRDASALRTTLDQERRRNTQIVADLRKQLEKVKLERDTLQIDLRQARDANSYLETEMKRQHASDVRIADDLTESLVHAQSAGKRDQETIDRLRADLDEARMECDMLRKQYENYRATTPVRPDPSPAVLTSSIIGTPLAPTSTSKELGKLRAMMMPSDIPEQDTSHAIRQRQEARTLKSELDSLRIELEQAESLHQTNAAKARAEERVRREAEHMVNDLRSQVESLTVESETLQRSVMALKQTANRDAAALKETEAKLRQANDIVAQLRGELDGVEPRIGTLERENRTLEQRVQSLSTELNETVTRSDENAQALEEELVRLTGSSRELATELDQAKSAEERAAVAAEELQLQLQNTRREAAAARDVHSKELKQLRDGSEVGTLRRELVSARNAADSREASLKQELSLVLDKVEAQRSEHTEVEQRLESELKRTRMDADTLQRELTGLHSESAAANAALDRLRDRMRRDKTQWADEHQAELRHRQDAHDREMTNLRDEMERETSRLREAAEREENAMITSLVREHKAETDRLQREGKQASDARDRLSKQVDKLREEVEVARAAAGAAERENERMNAELSAARVEQERWSRGGLAKEEETAKYRRQLAQSRAELEEYQKHVSTLESDLARVRTEASAKIPAVDYERERADTTRIKRELAQVQSERDSLRAQVKQLNGRITDMENGEEMSRVLAENIKLKTAIAGTEGSNAVVQGRIDSLVPELATQTKRAAELQSTVTHIEQEKAELAHQLDTLNTSHVDIMQRATVEVNNLRSELARLQQGDKQMRNEIVSRDAELEQSMATMDEARIEIGKIRTERDMLKSRVVTIEGQLEADKESHDSATVARDKEISELRASLNTISRDHASLVVTTDAAKQQNAMLTETLKRETDRGEEYRRRLYESQSEAKQYESTARNAVAELDIVSQERDRLASSHVEMEQSIAQMTQRNNEVEGELAKSMADMADRDFELRRVNEDRSMWKSQADVHREAVEAWRKRSRQAEEEKEAITEEMESRLADKDKTTAAMEHDHSQLKTQFDLVASQRVELQSQLDEEHQQSLRLKTERDEMASRSQVIQEEAKKKEKVAEALSMQVQDLHDRAHAAETEKSQLQAELRQTSRDLDETQHRFQQLSASRPVRPPPAHDRSLAEALQGTSTPPPRRVNRSNGVSRMAVPRTPISPGSVTSRASRASVALQEREKQVLATEDENTRLMQQAEQDLARMKDKEKRRARGVQNALSMAEGSSADSRRGSVSGQSIA